MKMPVARWLAVETAPVVKSSILPVSAFRIRHTQLPSARVAVVKVGVVGWFIV
jgi:hypothetical protein